MYVGVRARVRARARVCVWVSHLSAFERADRLSRHFDVSTGGQPSAAVFFYFFFGAFAKL
jgi:hypothetical protein